MDLIIDDPVALDQEISMVSPELRFYYFDGFYFFYVTLIFVKELVKISILISMTV